MAALHATTVMSASLGAAFVGLVAFAAAAPAVAAAFIEDPPAAPVPRTAIVLAVCWCAAFGVAAVRVATSSAALGVVGVLVAASCLAAAAVVWFARSRPRGGRVRRRRRQPPGPGVPESYWARWESEFRRGCGGGSS
jgi:hypothetical protein